VIPPRASYRAVCAEVARTLNDLHGLGKEQVRAALRKAKKKLKAAKDDGTDAQVAKAKKNVRKAKKRVKRACP